MKGILNVKKCKDDSYRVFVTLADMYEEIAIINGECYLKIFLKGLGCSEEFIKQYTINKK